MQIKLKTGAIAIEEQGEMDIQYVNVTFCSVLARKYCSNSKFPRSGDFSQTQQHR